MKIGPGIFLKQSILFISGMNDSPKEETWLFMIHHSWFQDGDLAEKKDLSKIYFGECWP